MVNKIGTLKDDNNNPYFPIAGGMAEDSITTQMLKDDSVTSDKIDWTTLGNKSVSLTKSNVSADTDFNSITATVAGTFFVVATAWLNYSGGTAAYPGLLLRLGSSTNLSTGQVGPLSNSQVTLSATAVVTLSVGDVIHAVNRNITTDCYQGSLSIIRIG